MDQPKEIRFRADSVSLLNIVINYWKVLLVTFVSAIAVSAACSFLIRPLYRATVVLYPTTNASETQSLFGVQANATPLFGDELATEKVLQILKSDNIRNYIVGKYDLMRHYGISPNARYKYTMLENRIKKYIVSRKTQYSSVEINVLDPDRNLCASIANDIGRQVDTVFNQIVKDAGKKSVQALSVTYAGQYKRVRSLEDSLRFSFKGDLPPDMFSTSKGNSEKSSWTTAATRFTPEAVRLISMFQAENENLSAIRNKLTEARMASEQDLPYTYIINGAKVPEKKALPKRTLIVIASAISSLILMTFILAAGRMVVRDE